MGVCVMSRAAVPDTDLTVRCEWYGRKIGSSDQDCAALDEVTERGHDEEEVEHRVEEMKESGQVYFLRVDGEDWIAMP